MRRIVFRGYDSMKGWVYGDLVHNQKVTRTGLVPRVMVGGYEVDEKSVGQHIGIKDRNGKDVYEGDIVYVFLGSMMTISAQVVWSIRCSAFMLDKGDGVLAPITENIEVIGNNYKI